ncbi:glycoside hydrolase family 88 protein [Kutzneria sp. CA-103260]|uniref:glycoside hydrolase family 88 protein n=1 Tax=Kutzneria sp. CA-103260 TaxID=2802641 RepID=UPI001BAB455F|nr:glycoside hydrolase family 88 protein [Kutzneria sp. CA-103260]QUQ66925.1 unsaturated glucuronyl hydrolase [Kutzneria sp. CA-103260]
MTGLDPSSAEHAEPLRPPVDPSVLTVDVLADTGRRIGRRAAEMGLRRWFWGEGVVLLGLLRLASAAGDPLPPFVVDYVDNHLRQGIAPDHVNSIIPGAACAWLYKETGERRYADACEQLLSWLAERTGPGALEHWPGGVWADTAFMAGVFLVQCGQALGRPELIAEAARQWLAHADVLRDPATGLFAHGSHRGETVWCFWGRANAWIALSGVEILEADPSHGHIRELLSAQLAALAGNQPAHGVWDVLVDGHPETRGIIETSATAGIAAALFRAAALGVSPAVTGESAWRAMGGLHPYVAADGAVTRTSAGTVLQLVPFGYSVIRDDRIQPWGQGLGLHAYAAALVTRSCQ